MLRLNTAWKVAIPAAIVAIILIYRTFTPSVNEKLFLAYYAPADTIYFSTPRGESEDYQAKLNAFHEFKSGNFETSLSLIKAIKESDEETALLNGLNLIQLNQYSEAIASLQKAKGGSPAISHAASWYLALLYVKMGDKGSALNELNLLAGSESEFKLQAVELIEELK